MDVTILGIGSLGSAIAMELNGKAALTLIDRDFVEGKNILNQVLYVKSDIGKTKIDAALGKLNAKGLLLDIDQSNIDMLGRPDILICCTDTFQNKLLINEYCRKKNICAIFVSASERRAMILPVKNAPCFYCLFFDSDEDCEINGIDILTAKIAAKLVSEEIDRLNGAKYDPTLVYICNNDVERLKIKSRKGCNVCNGRYAHLDSSPKKAYRLCGDTFIIRSSIDFESISFPDMIRLNDVIHYKGFTFFSDGRVFVRASDEKEAKRKLNSLIGHL